ncbi:hypothetical protein NP493_454g04013 [Ridgeia piscesae]|uniref:Hexosyltransferase n=1 Tax=Ridgeia piscesae TaxID=27915 RepID=A0AAD9KYT8_RIDPI|nr:hypothetical protein NP493_454g04013 [Ridgeia piscesae]
MRRIPRVLLLLFALCASTMIFITRCGLNFDPPMMQSAAPKIRRSAIANYDDGPDKHMEIQPRLKSSDDGANVAVSDTAEDYLHEVTRLRTQIAHLQEQLTEARTMAKDVLREVPKNQQYEETARLYEKHFARQRTEAELTNGVPLNNEYELFPFCRFTLTRVYIIEPGLGKRVVEKPIGAKKRDILEVIDSAIEKLNGDGVDRISKYTVDDFLEGIYRNVPGIGTQYELYFHNVDEPTGGPTYRKVTLARLYGPITTIETVVRNTRKDMINLILPLSGRVDKFEAFIHRFVSMCVRRDKRVFLTVVYFRAAGLDQVRRIITALTKRYHFKNVRLVTLDEDFSRGRGLQVGAQSWTKNDVLMFLCDVDIVFTTDFLERCRLNTDRGRRVYYPIVFSLYNPRVVYSLQDMTIPPEKDQLIISKDAGFWRDFGYGMTCQYRSDFMKIKGFDEKITGWGLEDVYLYRKYVKSELMVIRATDPGIFHLWHEKECDLKLPADQYRGCIRSRALNEASHAQMGMLAFKDEIDAHMNLLKSQSQSLR